MKTSFLTLIVFFATLQISAQNNKLGYHRSDGSYVTPQHYSLSDGCTYDSWRCIENTTTITRNNYRNYPKKKHVKTVYEYTYSSPSRTNYKHNPSKSYFDNSKYSIYYVTSKSLNVYLGPSLKHKLTGSLDYAESVTVLDSYSNGWYKIQYLYYDKPVSSFITRTGYVSGNHLSASKPYDNKYYENHGYNSYKTNYNSFNSNIYSSIEKAAPNMGIGGLTIWTNCSTDGEIKVYLDGDYVGILTHVFSKGVPNCGEPGTLFIEKEAGTYYLEAKGELYTWSGTITIVKNKCLIQGLER